MQKKNKQKKIIAKVILSVFMVLILIGIIPIIITSAYSVLVADDFSHANTVGYASRSIWGYIGASFEFTKTKYLTWQGTWFSMFIQALLSPINNYGLPQLKVVMVTNAILFFMSLLFFVYSLCKVYGKKVIGNTVFMYSCFVYMLTAYKSYREIFYWFSGATSYSYPLSLFLIALGAAIRYQKDRKYRYLLLAMVSGFIATGGSLTVVGTGCYLGLLVFIFVFLKDKTLRKGNCIWFGVWVLGALTNAGAPGNFVRQQMGSEAGIEPISAAVMSVKDYYYRIRWFAENSDMVALFFVLVLIGIIFGGIKLIDKNYLVVSALSLFLPIVTAFPVALGYPDGYYPNRCIFVADLAVIIVMINTALVIGTLLRHRVIKNVRGWILGVALLSIFVCCVDNFSIRDNVSLYTIRSLKDHTYQNYYDRCERFYESLENREGEEIIITEKDYPGEIHTVYCFYLTTDASNWVNRAVSGYYKLESIKITKEN